MLFNIETVYCSGIPDIGQRDRVCDLRSIVQAASFLKRLKNAINDKLECLTRVFAKLHHAVHHSK